MAAGGTYTTIATTTLGSSQSSVTFSSLGSYTDLVLDVTGTSNIPANVGLRFNSDTGSNYSWTNLFERSEGSGARGTGKTTNQNILYCNWYTAITADALVQIKVNIQGYANSTTNKTILSRANTTPGNTTFSGNEIIFGLWRSTSPITSVTVYCDGANFSAGSKFNLYGITAA